MSHILNGSMTEENIQKTQTAKGVSKESVDLTICILTEIWKRKCLRKVAAEEQGENKGEEKGINLLENVYRDTCLAVIAR